MSRITRKELKTDKFALEVEHGISFFEEHKNEAVKYGAIAVGVIVLIVGYSIYSRGQHSAREQALAAAIRVQEAPVGVSGNGGLAFPSQDAKDQETIRVFTDLQTRYSGSAEGEIAQYYLGSIKADQGKLAEAEKLYQEVAQKGDDKYASLAKFSLAQIYFADGRSDQGEKLLRDLIATPDRFRLRGSGHHLAGSLPGAEETCRGAQVAGSVTQPARERGTNGALAALRTAVAVAAGLSCWRGCDFRWSEAGGGVPRTRAPLP